MPALSLPPRLPAPALDDDRDYFLSRDEVAQRLGCTPSMVARIEDRALAKCADWLRLHRLRPDQLRD